MTSFTGGAKLEKYLKETAKKVSNPGTLNVGFLEDATYPDGTSVAMVAAIQEFGSPAASIPPRPFFRTMIAKESPEWGPTMAAVLRQTDYDAKQALGLMGEEIKGQLQESIISTNEPPLSPITVMLRGMRSHDQGLVVTGATVGEAAQRVADGKTNYGASTKVLNDTGHLIDSVDYEVVGGGEG